MSISVRMTLEGDKELEVGPHNDKRTIEYLRSRYGDFPVSVTLQKSQCEELSSDLHDLLNSVASLDCQSDDIDAMSWVNSLWTLSTLIVCLSRVSEDGRYTSANIRVG